MPNKQSVLIIEDETVQRQVLLEKLQSEGYKVFEASDGATGLKNALENQPDIILLDNRMPEMSGYEMLRRLRKSGNWGETVPVIFLSNIEPSTKDEREDLEAIAPTAYLLKSDTDLVSIIAKIKETLKA
jgi:CheY-like chemotaxis protein